MGETLFGSTESGTPIETRGATKAAGNLVQDTFKGAQSIPDLLATLSGPFQRMSMAGAQNILGMGPGAVDLGNVFQSLMADPASQTQGLFNSLIPFENEQVEQNVAQQRNVFGTSGARFSRNLLNAETALRGRMAGEFQKNRQQALLSAQGNRLNAANAFGNLMLGAQQGQAQNNAQALQALMSLLQFAAPGTPIVKEGLAPGLLQAGVMAASMAGG